MVVCSGPPLAWGVSAAQWAAGARADGWRHASRVRFVIIGGLSPAVILLSARRWSGTGFVDVTAEDRVAPTQLFGAWYSVSEKLLRSPPAASGLLPALVGFHLAVAV